jgi:2-polyprenyl-3-methyl-5-hydroxy-6-metoxy-1,4-benzoquinol methylase
MIDKNFIDSERDQTYASCDLCGSEKSNVLFEKDGFKHVKCCNCDLVYVNPRLKNPLERQETFYNNLAASSGDLNREAYHDYTGSRKKRLLKEAAMYLPYNTNGRILDIGCGFGGFLKAASERGWEYPEGIEIAPQAAEYTARFFTVKTNPLEETQYNEYAFDVIRLNNVIEHVPSPKTLMQSVYNSLRPGGLFVISTPNFDSLSVTFCGKRWQYIGGDDHIYLFTPKTISQMLKETGFRVVGIKTKGVHITPKDHVKKPSSYREKLLKKEIKLIEKILDFFFMRTLRGHRLKVWAEKI